MPTPTENDERVICSSCQFRYARIRGFCPLCGISAPNDDAPCHARNAAEGFPQRPRKATPALAPMTLLICASLFMVRSDKAPIGAAQTFTTAGTFLSSSRTSAAAPQSAPQRTRPSSRDFSSTESRAENSDEGTHDPAELWTRVQRGSTNAEIELAKLYLDGKEVAQNCEQAHLLLLAASKKRSSVASRLLSGAYYQRCR